MAAWMAIVLMAGIFLAAARHILIPLALAVLIWQLINAIAGRFRRLRFRGRPPEDWERLALSVATIIVALLFVVNLIMSNVSAVSAAAPALEANLLAMIPRLASAIGLPAPENTRDLLAQLDLDVIIRSISATLASFASSMGLVALYVAFMLFEQHTFDQKIEALFPDPQKASAARRILGHMEQRIERYLWIKTLISLATAFLSWCVLASVGCGNAGFWALVIFIVNYIPVMGSFLGVVFPSLLILVQYDSLGTFIATLIGLGVVQFSLGSVLEPRLMGSSLNLSPVVIIVSLAVWGWLWGIAGMFLCVPLMVIIMIVCAHFESTRPLAILLSSAGRLDRDVTGEGQTA
ncbi:MAG: AI-2E family transporter [Geminicoccaceae bacterium]